MVSPGTLQLVNTLGEGENRTYEPTISDAGEVSYPDAEGLLDDRDDGAVVVLERLADRGVLDREFQSKVYICPECLTEGMQYSSACPSCGSIEAFETTLVEHTECGTVDVEESYRNGVCPGCERQVTEETLSSQQRYVCQGCESWFDTPANRLRCRDCLHVCQPSDSHERVLYIYALGREGDRWLDDQLRARGAIADELSDRRFETTIDAVVTADDGTDYPVHVYAVDSFLDNRIVAEIHDTPTRDDVEYLLDASRALSAHPILVTTSGVVGEVVSDRLAEVDVTVMTATEDGGLEHSYRISDEPRSTESFMQRLASSLDVSGWK